MELCQKELLQLLSQQHTELHERLNSHEFNNFVARAQTNLEEYRSKLHKVKSFVKDQKSYHLEPWLADYIEETLNILDKGKSNLAHGFNGAKVGYPLSCASRNPTYCTGLLYRETLGNQSFPIELSLLDSAAFTYLNLIRALLEKRCLLHAEQKQQLIALANKLLNGVQQQKKLFGQLESVLKRLQDSHQALMQTFKNNGAAAEKLLEMQEATNKWIETHQDSILENTVGNQLFSWSTFITATPLKLTSFKDRIHAAVQESTWFNVVTFPVLITQGIFSGWARAAATIDTSISNMRSVKDLTDIKQMKVEIPELPKNIISSLINMKHS